MSTRSDEVLLRETHPLPKTVDGIAEFVRELLSAPGRCDRLVIDRLQSIRVWRWQARDPMEEDDLDIDAALRNAEIIEYANPNEDKTPEEVVFHMTHMLRREGAYPVCWVVGPSREPLELWLRMKEVGLPGELRELLLTPIQHLKTLPDETLMLAGAPIVEGDVRDIKIAVKTVIEPRRENHAQADNRNADRSRAYPGGHSSAARQVASPAGGNARESWSPSSFLRAKLSRGRQIR